MGKALYRAYRARKFKDVIGQEHITKTLETALRKGHQSHAYLLTGPRGVGKTSIARILAHEVNGLPYVSEQPPIDIIEIDAASNRRIDEIRDIKEKASIAPVQAKYKVYIIDEVHMLTKESFNALLKTLEEPPKHVIFVLATTEFHKLPETIISRCIHFPFKPIGKPDVIKHLKKIAKAEKIDIEPEALELIAVHGSGSFRDSISLLDQVRSFGAKITLDDVRHALGLAPAELISRIQSSISRSDIKAVSDTLETMYEFGADATIVSKQILESVRSGVLEGNPPLGPADSVLLMQKLLDVQSSANPKRELELILIGAAIDNQLPTVLQPEQAVDTDTATQSQPPASPAKTVSKTAADKSELWDKALKELKSTNSTLYSIVRMADYEVDKDSLILRFEFPFHHKQASQAKNLDIINAIVGKASGGKYKIKVALSSQEAKRQPSAKNHSAVQVEHKNISNIFGSSEVLES